MTRTAAAALLLLPALAGSSRAEIASGPSPTYTIEAIRIHGNTKTKGYIIERALHVRSGERLSVDDPRFEVSRFRVLSLGYFSEVRLRLERGSRRGWVVLVVEVVERGTIIITDLFFGSSEATAAWGGLGVAENNFLGRGISLEGTFVLGSDPEVERAHVQQAYRLRVGTPRLNGGPLSIFAGFSFLDGSDFFRRSGSESTSNPADFLSIRYRRISGTLGFGFDLSRTFRMYLDYRGEAVSSDIPMGAVLREPDGATEPIRFGIIDGASILSVLALTFERDTRSDPVLPQAGSLLTVTGEFSSAIFGSSYDYFKIAGRYQHYFPVKWGHVIALQIMGGVVFGEAPFFEKFFIGDLNDLLAHRALGLNFSTLPSLDVFGTSIDSKRYEEISARVSMEYIVPWFRGGRFAYAGDFFVNLGVFTLLSKNDFRVRDRSLSESFPVDLTLDAGLRLDTQIGVFRLSIGNALGRIPF
jgi:outer membrane protein insertion porin family